MYTQCPDCQTAFRVTAKVLQQAGGRVQCGGCSHTFNAVDHLSELPPQASSIGEESTENDIDAGEPSFEERNTELLKTLDDLAGPDEVRIEDTGIEWRVLNAEDELDESEDHADVDSEESPTVNWYVEDSTEQEEFASPGDGPPIDEQVKLDLKEPVSSEPRYDDSTPLPDDYEDDETESSPHYVPASTAIDDPSEVEEPIELEDRQVDLALGDPDEWSDLLDEVDSDPGKSDREERLDDTGSAELAMETEEELAAIHSELTANPPAEGTPNSSRDPSTSDDEEANLEDASSGGEDDEPIAKELSEDDEHKQADADSDEDEDDVEVTESAANGPDHEEAVENDELSDGELADDEISELAIADADQAEADDNDDELVVEGLDEGADLELVIDGADEDESAEDDDEPALENFGEDDLGDDPVDKYPHENKIDDIDDEPADQDDDEDEMSSARATSDDFGKQITLIDDSLADEAANDEDSAQSDAENDEELIVANDEDVAEHDIELELAGSESATPATPLDDDEGENTVNVQVHKDMLRAMGDEKFAASMKGEDGSPLIETIIMEGDFIHGAIDLETEEPESKLPGDLHEPTSLIDTYVLNRRDGSKGAFFPLSGGTKTAGVIILAIVLVAQLTHSSREYLATFGAFNQTIGPVYRILGQPVTPTWNIKGWQFETTNGSTDENEQHLTIQSRISNRSDQALPFPLVHVSLTDRWEEIVASRVLEPNEYLAGDSDPRKPVAAGDKFTATITIAAPSPDVTGFKLNVCYRLSADSLSCAIEDFK